MGNDIIFAGGYFYEVLQIWGVILTIPTFLKVSNNINYYWASIKIKLRMTCVFKEYDIKIKMVQEQWLHLKMKFLLGYNMKIVI